jgi:hypothetical protein
MLRRVTIFRRSIGFFFSGLLFLIWKSWILNASRNSTELNFPTKIYFWSRRKSLFL